MATREQAGHPSVYFSILFSHKIMDFSRAHHHSEQRPHFLVFLATMPGPLTTSRFSSREAVTPFVFWLSVMKTQWLELLQFLGPWDDLGIWSHEPWESMNLDPWCFGPLHQTYYFFCCCFWGKRKIYYLGYHNYYYH